MNCKPGMLAVLIRSSIPENVGTVLEILDDGRYDSENGGWLWLTRSTRPLSVVWSDSKERAPSMDTIAYAADVNLRPITPPPGSVSESEVKKLYSGRELVNIVKERL